MSGREALGLAFAVGLSALLASSVPSSAGDETPRAGQPEKDPSAESSTSDVAGSMPPSRSIEDGQVRVFITSDTRGYLEPCGCERGQFGGVARRATFLEKQRRPGDLLLDLGNLTRGQRPVDRLKFSYVLRALEEMGYDALVPGEGELALGEDFEKAALFLKGAVVVCANLYHRDGGARVFAPWVVRKIGSGHSVAVVGLTSPWQPLPERYRVGPPEDALRECLTDIAGKADAVIVAGHLEGKPLLELAAQFPNVRLFLGGRVPVGSAELLRRGGSPVLLAGERGQHVGWVQLGKALTAEAGGLAWLGEEVADDHPLMVRLLAEFQAEAVPLGEAFAREAVARFRKDGWVGSAACAECHPGEYAAWNRSGHSHAVATLKERNSARNPECLSCHLQDVTPSTPPGLETHSPGAVGCEACHGAGAKHVKLARAAPERLSLRLMSQGTLGSCQRCHDKENSRNFELTKYWERIRHGSGGNEEERR